MKRSFSKRSFSSEEALNQVLRLIEEDEDDDDIEDNGNLEELGEDVDFERSDNDSIEPEETDENENMDTDLQLPEEILMKPVYNKKLLTRSRIVNSIDNAEDERNYNAWVEPTGDEKVIIGKLDKESLQFTNKKPSQKGGQSRRQNIIKPPIGVHNCGKDAMDPISAFRLFVDDEYLEKIVLYSNVKITGVLNRMRTNGFIFTNKHRYMKETNIEELRAFIGLFIYRGLNGMNNHSTTFLFSKRGPPMFSATLSRERFKFLTCFISFDMESERRENYKKDRFAAFRELMEDFNEKCLRFMAPGDYLSLDETLYGMRNQVMFKIFIANKPHKYGLLFKSINAARYPYTFCSMPYCGKPEDIENATHFVQGTENAVKHLVIKMQISSCMEGRNITFDRLYTSISLARWLYSNSITMLGTFQNNRKGVPAYLKETKDKEVLSNEIFWLNGENHMSLSSYTVKTASKGKKNVLMLSTMDIPLGTTIDDGKNKMAHYKLYDFTMGGTDAIDYRCAKYSCKPKSRRWTIVAWCYTLDMFRNNSQTIYAMNTGKEISKVDSLSFGLDIVDSLVKPFIQSRNLSGLQSDIIRKMEVVLDRSLKQLVKDKSHPFPGKSETKSRCNLCEKECEGEGSKRKKSNLCRLHSCCMSCGKHTCVKHLIQECISCTD